MCTRLMKRGEINIYSYTKKHAWDLGASSSSPELEEDIFKTLGHPGSRCGGRSSRNSSICHLQRQFSLWAFRWKPFEKISPCGRRSWWWRQRWLASWGAMVVLREYEHCCSRCHWWMTTDRDRERERERERENQITGKRVFLLNKQTHQQSVGACLWVVFPF